jgi:hypothetical protein
MKEDSTQPVRVTGEEHKHPEIRKLARACIEIARLRLAQQKASDKPTGDEGAQPAAPKQEASNG